MSHIISKNLFADFLEVRRNDNTLIGELHVEDGHYKAVPAQPRLRQHAFLAKARAEAIAYLERVYAPENASKPQVITNQLQLL